MCRIVLLKRNPCGNFDPVAKDDDWPATLVAAVAAEVRHYRSRRGWSVRELSVALKERRGVAIAPAVLSNLELGRRPLISLGEVFALADVLGVPALLLMFPLGRRDAVEVLPGVELSPWAALQWATYGVPPEDDPREPVYQATIEDFRIHEQYRGVVERTERRSRELRESLARDGGQSAAEIQAELDDLQQRRDGAARMVVKLREMLRREGLEPPELPPSLRYFDREDSP